MLNTFLFVFMCIVVCLWTYTSSSRGYKLPPAYSVELPITGHAYLILGTPAELWRTLRKFSMACIDNGGVMYFKIFNQIHYFDIWKQRHKYFIPAFSLPVVQGFMDVFNDQSKKIACELERYVRKGQFIGTKLTFPNILFQLNITLTYYIFNKYFYEAFLLTAFGVNVNEDYKLVENYMQSVELYESIAMTRFQKPWLTSDFLFNLFGYKKIESELLKNLRKLFNVVLHKKKLTMKDIDIYEEWDDRENRGKPLLNLLLELSSNNLINENDIADEVNTTLIGSYESIANMLLVTMVFLGQYPEVQKRSYEEVMEVISNERDVYATDVPKLVYMEAVVLEALRFYTTAPALPRQVETDVNLKNYTLRRGTYCIILPTRLHNNDAWGDSVQFRPERWLDPETLPKKCYSGFSLGKRNCIVKTYSLYKMKVALVHF